MRINLIVPWKDYDEIKRLCARWDASIKKWYVKDVENLEPFLKWMPEHLKRPCKPINQVKEQS